MKTKYAILIVQEIDIKIAGIPFVGITFYLLKLDLLPYKAHSICLLWTLRFDSENSF